MFHCPKCHREFPTHRGLAHHCKYAHDVDLVKPSSTVKRRIEEYREKFLKK